MSEHGLEELRYKVRRRVGRGDDQRWEILGPRGWIAESDEERRKGIRSLARHVADLLRAQRSRNGSRSAK